MLHLPEQPRNQETKTMTPKQKAELETMRSRYKSLEERQSFDREIDSRFLGWVMIASVVTPRDQIGSVLIGFLETMEIEIEEAGR